MSNGKTDQAKGRIKQAAGDLTGNKSLKREGKVDEGAGKVKDKLGQAKRATERAVDKAANKAKRAADRRG
jgi:uncharacterized protein YjbJ (UPF0337 family)